MDLDDLEALIVTSLLIDPRTERRGEDQLAPLARAARNNRLDAGAQHDYGFGLLTSAQIEESVEYLERAVRLDPVNPAYHTNLAAAYHQTGRWNEGLWHAHRAYEFDLTNAMTAVNIGLFYYWMGETRESADWLEKAITIQPSHWQAWWSYLFMLDFLPITAEEALAVRRRFAAIHEAPRIPYWPKHTNDPDPERKLRIGLIGGSFHQHSSSYAWGPIFEHLDRDRFSLIAYAHLTHHDALSDWLQGASNAWRDVTNCADDRVVAEQIMRDRIDVLVDLGTYGENSHLMAHLHKPAPISMTAWGHLTGTALACMDGLLTDRIMVPENRTWELTEKPAYVPFAYGWYRPKELPDLGAAPETLTFGYLGRIQKLDDPTVALWADLLHAHPGSRLLLKDVAYDHERAAVRTVERFEAWGIDPQRIELRGMSGRDEHLATYHDVSVALDPLPQSGGATTLESLMMGVPTVTLRGDRLVRRLSASSVTVAGHPEWVAETETEYVEIAGRAARDRGPSVRDDFLASHICDGAARTRAFESAIRDLWRGWCRERTVH